MAFAPRRPQPNPNRRIPPAGDPKRRTEQTAKPGEQWRQLNHTFHTSTTFMDYLHGDVKKEEAPLACAYEYARESPRLWELAKERDELLRDHRNLTRERAVLRIVEQDARQGRPHPPWEWRFLMRKSFPTKDWNELSPEDRQFIMRWDTRQFPPLRMPDVLWEPEVSAMHPKFKTLAEVRQPPIEEVQPGQPSPPMPYVPAMVPKTGALYYCVFEVDFSESEDALKEQFVAWLKVSDVEKQRREHKKKRTAAGPPLRPRKVRRHWQALYWLFVEVDLSARKGALTKRFLRWLRRLENRKRLDRYAKGKRGKTGDLLNRLKDLAAWRLHREHDNNCNQANKFADDHRKRFEPGKARLPYHPGDPRPFHNARAPKTDLLVRLNQPDLFSCDDDYRHAKGRVLEALAGRHPAEFKPLSLPPALKEPFQTE